MTIEERIAQMRRSDYGPVPVSRIKAESADIYESLAEGRRVLISRRGRVEAVLDPADDIPDVVTLSYVSAGLAPLLDDCTATDVGQGYVSAHVIQAVHGHPRFFSRENHLYGLMRRLDDWELAAEGLNEEEAEAEREAVETAIRFAEEDELTPEQTRQAVAKVRSQFRIRIEAHPDSIQQLEAVTDHYLQVGDVHTAIRQYTEHLVELHAQAGPNDPVYLLAKNNLVTVLAHRDGPSVLVSDMVTAVSAKLEALDDPLASKVRDNAVVLSKQTVSQKRTVTAKKASHASMRVLSYAERPQRG